MGGGAIVSHALVLLALSGMSMCLPAQAAEPLPQENARDLGVMLVAQTTERSDLEPPSSPSNEVPPVEPPSAEEQEAEPAPTDTAHDASTIAVDELTRFRRGTLTLGIGGAYWPNIHNVQPNPTIFDPTAFGSPNTWGISVELSGHFRLTHWDRVDLFVGLDLGFINHENTKTFDTPGTTPGSESSRLLSQMIYFTPSMKLYYHTPYGRPFIGGGAGIYAVEFAARTERGAVLEEFVNRDAFGGYVSAGIDIPIRMSDSLAFLLRIEDKFHIVDFGSLGNFSPSSGSLTGPINMVQLQIGLAF